MSAASFKSLPLSSANPVLLGSGINQKSQLIAGAFKNPVSPALSYGSASTMAQANNHEFNNSHHEHSLATSQINEH